MKSVKNVRGNQDEKQVGIPYNSGNTKQVAFYQTECHTNDFGCSEFSVDRKSHIKTPIYCCEAVFNSGNATSTEVLGWTQTRTILPQSSVRYAFVTAAQ